MNIAVIGTGYVGLVTGACLAETGADVVCVDVNEIKIEGLKKGVIPIYEPGLDEIVERNYKVGRLQFSTRLRDAVQGCSVVFIAVGTPPHEDGSADLNHVLSVAREIGRSISSYTIVVTKSTVPVGTSAKVKAAVRQALEERGADVEFDVASNPEFLKEGSAIDDFLRPDRIVIGTETNRASETLQKLYHPFVLNGHPLLFMDIPSAELTKYAANAMLATKISFMNDIANLCELTGADVDAVRKGIGSDPRIGTRFIYPGIGYGGSCFPKDVKALIRTGKANNYCLRILESVDAVNNDQKQVMFAKIKRYFGEELAGKTIAVWGIAFKPNTDDIREAPALVLIDSLLQAGAHVQVYDPVAMTDARYLLNDHVLFAGSALDAVKGAHALVLVTEWSEFRLPDWKKISDLMRHQAVFDGRNIYNPAELQESGFAYHCIGRTSSVGKLEPEV